MQPYHRFDPSVRAATRDPAVQALLAAVPLGQSPTLTFGSPHCPPGAVLVSTLDCCWAFERGATDVVEHLSLGASNVWLVDWVCDAEQPRSAILAAPPSARPWCARHPDVTLFVFPMGIDATFVCADAAIAVPSGSSVGKLNFFPNGKSTYAPDNRTYAVTQVFAGFEFIFGCLDAAGTNGFRPPTFFLGDSREARMVRFMRRFGL